MAGVALQICRATRMDSSPVEEEGTDNLPNSMNAAGTLEALARADAAVGVIREFVDANPDTLMVMAADSARSGLQVITGELAPEAGAVAASTDGGGRLFGQQGAFGDVFMSAPDKEG